MSELTLELSEKFRDEADDIRAELSKHLKVGQPLLTFRRSADLTLPSLITLLGGFLAWKVLYPPAKAFLETLGKRAGEAAWDKIASRNEVKPLADVATTLATVAARVDGEVVRSFGLNIPDDRVGTLIFVKSSDPEAVARVLAYFVVHAEQLSKAMQAEVAAGHTPFGPAIIELQDDESLGGEMADTGWSCTRTKNPPHEIVTIPPAVEACTGHGAGLCSLNP